MCGIVAVVVLENFAPSKFTSSSYRANLTASLDESLETIGHRGPDYRGRWISPDNRIALGHVRLSINDLSQAGHQPFCDENNDIYAVVNGEFYGHEGIREELWQEYSFTSTSDSEIVIALYLKYGVHFLSKLRGEFSVVLYDTRNQFLLAARDRYGVKPLFWTVQDGRLLIASEAKAFLPQGWKAEWDVPSIAAGGWLHDERTLFRDVLKLRPGHYLTCSTFDYIQTRQYWDVEYPDKQITEARSDEKMADELRERLVDSVRVRMRADVPVGIYLSGGIDSAAIAGIAANLHTEMDEATMNGQRPRKPECFGIGFEGSEFDETEIAQRTAEFCGLAFHTKRITDEELAKNFAEATFHTEHHDPDLNYVAKYVLSTLPGQHAFKVVLTGEGSDEIFGGYPLFHPDFLREPDLSSVKRPISEEKRMELLKQMEERIQNSYQGSDSTSASARTLAQCALNGVSITSQIFEVTLAHFAPWTRCYGDLSVARTHANNPDGRVLALINTKWHPLHTAQYIWIKSFLANFNLTCLGDRMEMSHSIEGRPPFLDHIFTEYANNLPPSVKVRFDPKTGRLVEKWILREAVRPYITDELYKRTKHPFSAPITYPYDGHIHRLLKSLLTRENIEQLGFLDCDKTLEMLQQAFEGQQHPSANQAAIRFAFVAAQWIVLSQRFNVARAEPPLERVGHSSNHGH